MNRDVDHDVITAMAVLSLSKTADIDDVRVAYAAASMTQEQLDAHLEVLRRTPMAFIALLSEDVRVEFVEHVRNAFIQGIETCVDV